MMDAGSRSGSRNVRPSPTQQVPSTSSHARPAISGSVPPAQERNEALPDILNSHALPPYTRPRPNHRRFHPRNNQQSQQTRSARRHSSEPHLTELDGDVKTCCSKESCRSCITVATRFKWVLVGLAVLGIICVITGIVLGALHMSVGSSFLTLSLMFIGLGVMLVIVVGIGWRCTPTGHEPCHLLFGIGNHTGTSRRSRGSTRNSNDRNQWFGGVLYPEFRYRRPPPSYNASMQDYQQQLVIAQLQPNHGSDQGDYSLPSSPPPTYRSRASTIRTGLHITFPPQSGGDYPSSGPPTYRSRASNSIERPSLPLDNASTSQRIPRRAQMEDLTPYSGTPSCISQGTPELVESSQSSTLYRVQQAVQYLDSVIETQREEARMMRSRTSSSVSRGVQVSPVDGVESDDVAYDREVDTLDQASSSPGMQGVTEQGIKASTSNDVHASTSQGVHASTSQGVHASTSQGVHASTSQGVQASTSRGVQASTSQGVPSSTSQDVQSTTTHDIQTGTSKRSQADNSKGTQATISRDIHMSGASNPTAQTLPSDGAQGGHAEDAPNCSSVRGHPPRQGCNVDNVQSEILIHQREPLNLRDIHVTQESQSDHIADRSQAHHTIHARRSRSSPDCIGVHSTSNEQPSRHKRHSSSAEGHTKVKASGRKSSHRSGTFS